jgi:DNA-binding Xre family transcriptional regulator
MLAVQTAGNVPPAAPGTLPSTMAPGATTARLPALRHWRVVRALGQDELAEHAGVHPTSVQRGEAGQPLRLATIRRLAAALDVEPAELMRQPPKN